MRYLQCKTFHKQTVTNNVYDFLVRRWMDWDHQEAQVKKYEKKNLAYIVYSVI